MATQPLTLFLMTKEKIILILIFLVSFAIRFYNYNYPPLLWDEAALGYNSYSILHTAKDEYGQTMPLILKSFGDYKPALYSYIAIPFIAIFGLNPLGIRLPSILLGALTPILLFLLLKQKNKKLAYLAALLLTFNPYNIHFSRGAWETNILTFELLLASYFFLKNKYLLSALAFSSTLYTYQAGKMISLFLILILFLINKKDLQLKKLSLRFVLPLGLFTLPIIYGLLFSHTANRLGVVSLLSYPRNPTEVKTIISETNQTDYLIFHSQPTFFFRNALFRYFNHFSSRFLVFEGDWQNARNSAPYIGVLLYPSLMFLIIGLLSIPKCKNKKITLFFLLWLITAPIPAALTRDSVQAVRTMSFSIPLIYFAALGIYHITALFHKYRLSRFAFYLLLVTSYFLSFFYYSDLYHNHLVKKSPNEWLYGYQQAAQYVIENQSKYNQIFFTNFYGQPYIYYLFYSQYPPQHYQSQSDLIANSQGDVGTVDQIDNIRFTSVSLSDIQKTPHSLGIFSYDEILRQGIDKTPIFSQFIPLSPINDHSTFYAYQNN